MAFIPLVDTPPEELEISGTPSRPTITVPLAASEDGHRVVALEVRLWPGSWCGAAMHEFKFAIVTLDEHDETAVIFDRFLAAGYLGEIRSLVIPCVVAAARALVQTVKPDVIYRATYVTHPSEKALFKHHMVTDTIESIGYEVAQAGTDRYGRRFWLMTRHGAEDA